VACFKSLRESKRPFNGLPVLGEPGLVVKAACALRERSRAISGLALAPDASEPLSSCSIEVARLAFTGGGVDGGVGSFFFLCRLGGLPRLRDGLGTVSLEKKSWLIVKMNV